ncbi:MAG: molybdenum cofactor guanylyltransferase [Bacteroidetes bacterium]|nr:molybdenum cofactor guanylyltransferase [Bacteroidota bacterium]
MYNAVTGIILAGGKSRRMGKDKGLCLLNGRPLIRFAINLLETVCDRIILGANDPDYQSFGLPVVNDKIPDIGPMGGLYSCLEASETRDNFILSCDMPLVSEDLIRFILKHKTDYEVVIPLNKGLPEPMCAYYSQDIVPVLREYIQEGNYKIQDVFKAVNTCYLKIPSDTNFFSNVLFHNINTPHDLKKAEMHIKTCHP